MALSTTGRNEAVNGLATVAATISLHSADPGTTGANEIAGGTPAYARKAAAWSPAANGSRALSTAIVFDVAAGVTVSHFGAWNAGGAFLGGDVLRDTNGNPAPATFSGQGTYTITTATLTIN